MRFCGPVFPPARPCPPAGTARIAARTAGIIAPPNAVCQTSAGTALVAGSLLADSKAVVVLGLDTLERDALRYHLVRDSRVDRVIIGRRPMERTALLEMLADSITGVVRPHPIRVAVDGVDGVSKTTLAKELVDPIRRRGLPVIRASIDGFHHPRSVRYRRGRNSPEGYFRDSFNYDALTTCLLQPLGPGGSLCYRRAVFNYRTDSAVEIPAGQAPPNSILLFDGVFLLCPELRRHWDYSVFLDAPFEVTIPRCARRDGSSPDVNSPENRRYVDGQKLYFLECEPKRAATVVINYDNLTSPEIIAADRRVRSLPAGRSPVTAAGPRADRATPGS